MTLNPFLCIDLSISDSLRSVRKSVLIYETIIMVGKMATVIKNISTVPFYSLQEGKVKLVKFQSDGLPCFFT